MKLSEVYWLRHLCVGGEGRSESQIGEGQVIELGGRAESLLTQVDLYQFLIVVVIAGIVACTLDLFTCFATKNTCVYFILGFAFFSACC